MQLTFQIILILCLLAGIALVVLSMPGTWLMVVLAFLYGIFYPLDQGQTSLFWFTTWLVLMATVGELLEFLVGTLGSKAVAVKTSTIVVAFIGGIVGMILCAPLFLIGALFGMFLGCFMAALLFEYITERDWHRAWLAAISVFVSRLVATTLKTGVAVIMLVYILYKIF